MSTPTRAPAPAATGISGLDDILTGGIPRNRMYLVLGSPGAGKTTLALQFLLEGQRVGEPGLYVSLAETRDEVLQVAAAHGWSLAGIEIIGLDSVDHLISARAQTTVFHPSEVELNAVTDLIRDTARRIRPARVVFDSLSDLRLLAESPLRHRHQLLELKTLFMDVGGTVLLVDVGPASNQMDEPHVTTLVHGVIELVHETPEYGVARRKLHVRKLRGVAVREGYHDFAIETGGLRVFPRIPTPRHRPGAFEVEPVPTGNAELDTLLGGGIDRGTTTLIMGPAGSGKSSLSLLLAARMAERGEGGMLFTFDESLGILLSRARALGLDLEPHIVDGRLDAQQVDPAAISPGEFADRVRRGVERGARLMVIDSLNGYAAAMPGERYLLTQLHELTSYLNDQGVATVLIMAMRGMFNDANSPMELSYLADTVLSLRFFEVRGDVRRALAVVKKRTGRHETTIREIRFHSDTGLHLGPPLIEFSGVLSGTPLYFGNAPETEH